MELKEGDIINISELTHYPKIINTIIGNVEKKCVNTEGYEVTIECGSKSKIKLYESRHPQLINRDYYINLSDDDPYNSFKISCPVSNQSKTIYTGRFFINVYKSSFINGVLSYHKIDKPYPLFYQTIVVIRKYSLNIDNIPTELKELIHHKSNGI